MSLPRYGEYKDSGVGWTDGVPAHWEISTLARVSNERCDGPFGSGIKSEHYTEAGALVVRLQNIRAGRFHMGEPVYLDRAYFLAELFGHAILPGDVLVAGLGDENNLLGRACVAPDGLGLALVKADCFRFRANINVVLPDFLALQLSVGARYDAGMLASGTTRSRIPLGTMASRKVVVPPVAEQAAIVAFLDREADKIDILIAEQEKLIALLAEKRQATISHAVTRGLNLNAPMKDSGVPWLGEVPAHWDVVIFQRCVFVAEGQVNPEEEPYLSMILIAPNHVEGGTGRLLFSETSEQQSAESGKYFCESGDVIYSKIRPALRKVCIAPKDCLCSADMYPLRGKAGLSNSFLKWFILSEPFSALVVLESERVAMPKINRESLKKVWIALPPPVEQQIIVAFLETETCRLDTLRTEAELAVALLQERRSALIAAAVTGQIDVRQA